MKIAEENKLKLLLKLVRNKYKTEISVDCLKWTFSLNLDPCVDKYQLS